MIHGSCHCGACGWRLESAPQSVTACNCTICRRTGALWAYGFLGQDVTVFGPTAAYRRADGTELEFHFCPTCGSMLHNMAREARADGSRWIAVNCRMADPAPLLDLAVDHFDGHDAWADLPADGRRVRDMWF